MGHMKILWGHNLSWKILLILSLTVSQAWIMAHPLCVMPLDSSNGILQFCFSLIRFPFLLFSLSFMSHTHWASLCRACLWHKTCWIIWFQLISRVSPQKGINELWPAWALPTAGLKCEVCVEADCVIGSRYITSPKEWCWKKETAQNSHRSIFYSFTESLIILFSVKIKCSFHILMFYLIN